MAAAQTLPNITANQPLWSAVNSQTNYIEYTLEAAQVRITPAQLLLLHTTPIQLIPPPGVGQAIWVDTVCLKYLFNTTAYTLNAGTLKLFYGPVTNAHPLTADLSTGLLTATANRLTLQPPILIVGPDVPVNLVNQGIYLGNDGTANYTLGDATLDVTLMFSRTSP